MRINLPDDLNIEKSMIHIFIDWDTGDYVKTVHPAIDMNDTSALLDYYRIAEIDAGKLWMAKFARSIPEAASEGQWAETTLASAIPYDGYRSLSDHDKELIAESHLLGDFTLDLLWFVVDGLNWRPGVPVDESDPAWIHVWEKEEECGGTLVLVAEFLGMNELPWDWEPIVVREMGSRE